MIFHRRVLCCFLLTAPLVWAATGAPSTELANSLKGKVVFLRGMETGDKLSFDAQGTELTSDASSRGEFAYSAIKIDEAHLSDVGLEFTGTRYALMFDGASKTLSTSDISTFPISEPVVITVVRDAAHPEVLDSALKRIFAFSAEDALSGKSSDEAQADLETLGALAGPDGWPLGGDKKAGIYQVGQGVSAARMLQTLAAIPPDSDEDDAAANPKKRVEGVSMVSFIVDTNGRPIHLRILRSLDPDLNSKVIEAVSSTRYAPFTHKGKPVPVRMNMEINFRVDYH